MLQGLAKAKALKELQALTKDKASLNGLALAKALKRQNELRLDLGMGKVVQDDGVAKINDTFNQELQQAIDGELPDNHILQLGKPSQVLLGTGFPNAPIELRVSKLKEKSQTEWHKFDPKAIQNLPKALKEPMAVFAYGDKTKSQNVITQIEYNGKQFLVGVHFDNEYSGVQINNIRGLFPKDNHEWLNWITQGKALYLDKEKVQALINQQRINLADVEYLDLNLVESLVQNFGVVKQSAIVQAIKTTHLMNFCSFIY